jgi:hypothetical protein
MKTKTTFLLIIALITACSGNDQPTKINDTFFHKYTSESIGSAIDYLFSTNKWMNESKGDIDKIKIDLTNLVKGLGTYYGYELVSQTEITKNLKEYTFQLRYDLQPLRVKITYYRPSEDWRVQNFRYDSKLAGE